MEQYFKNFKRYAFRLELLQKYDVKEEKESFSDFLEIGSFEPSAFMKEFGKIIKKAVKKGAKMSRVRVIKFPLSDYLRYELEAYEINLSAGEEIFYISEKDYSKMKNKINNDFWIFDDLVINMNYDSKGKFLGFSKENRSSAKYIKFKDELLSLAIPISGIK